MPDIEPVMWHFVDALSVWGKEFASALGEQAPTFGWIPELSWTGAWEQWERRDRILDPPLRTLHFPMQRAYRRWPVGSICRTASRLESRLRAFSQGSNQAALILTSPYYAQVAERWQGPVVYYVTDLLIRYGGFRESQIRRLDERLCRAASLVCPNSKRIAGYLIDGAGCQPGKVVVVPNATRAANLLPYPSAVPGPLPTDLENLRRPVAGVIGNLAANMDWELLVEVVKGTPWLSWAFIGPTHEGAGSKSGQEARDSLQRMGGRVRFTGARPYGELAGYARAFDVAVLPYRKSEPTYSGSSTRFYEHLAACRPMVATRGFAELLEKEPMLRLASSSREMVTHLNGLRALRFQDGFEELRWKTSQTETWSARAALMRSALAGALGVRALQQDEIAVKIT